MSRILLEQRSIASQATIAATVVAIATALRLAVAHSLPPGFPFLTFFPAVLITAVFASVRAGVVAAVLCGLIAWYWFIPPFNGISLDAPALIAMAFYAAITATELFFIALSTQALQHVQAERERSLAVARSRDLMFSELQHRVSNNLATIGALLRMQSNKVASPDAKQALLESMQRLNTVARIQRSLYCPGNQEIEARSFLTHLATDTRDSFTSQTDAVVDVISDTFYIGSEQAIPFGLVASELIMNALEHARPPTGPTQVTIRCRLLPVGADGQRWLSLTIADNGPGISPDRDVVNSGSLGISIATQFARNLGGSLTMENRAGAPGAVAELQFPVASP